MTSIWHRANPQLRELGVYEPGKPIEETARELGIKPAEIIKLASNENPLGPSPKAVKAMRAAVDSAQLYPDAGGFLLRNALGARLGCARENIILGNGSNEIIEFVGHAFLQLGDDVITFEHAFVAYKLVAALFGARTIEIATPNFQPDPDALLAAITPKTKIIFIANPNNPTGALILSNSLDNFFERVPDNIVTVLDEAYFEFREDPPDTLRHVRDGRNVVVLRTFSKIHGLASLRIGYGIARHELIDVLLKTRQPFNVNGIAQVAALAALEDVDYLAETKRVVDAGRAFLEAEFTAMKLRFVPSAGNFVLVHVNDGPAVFQKMLARKIIVRPLVGYGLAEWLRITVGTMEQNKKCIAALKEVLA
ncbi:MAG TPA: histidinol-phosphate transaminase [Chthoniobacterales bacterium]|nr:histidinol-phosphate transaminase [Chthoniobacterales bacterium]